MNKALWTAGILATVLACTAPAEAGEGFVTKVRGNTLTIDKGADDGLEVGLEVTVIRPPDEAIIHPLTGENLGAPEIEIGMGKISKVSARAASIRLDASPIIPVRSGDVARFLTVEEMMMMDQEIAIETTEQATKERGVIRSEASRLARNIGSIQGSIRALESTIRDLRRFDTQSVMPQLNSINKKILEMQEELKQLRTTVTLLNTVEVEDIVERGEMRELTAEEVERLRGLIQEEIDKLQRQMPTIVQAPPAVGQPDLDMDPDMTGMEEEQPIYTQLWFLGLIGAIGLGGVAFWMYTHLAAGSDEDEEDDEDDELDDEEEEEDDDDIDVEEEEEDDIVVEETS